MHSLSIYHSAIYLTIAHPVAHSLPHSLIHWFTAMFAYCIQDQVTVRSFLARVQQVLFHV